MPTSASSANRTHSGNAETEDSEIVAHSVSFEQFRKINFSILNGYTNQILAMQFYFCPSNLSSNYYGSVVVATFEALLCSLLKKHMIDPGQLI